MRRRGPRRPFRRRPRTPRRRRHALHGRPLNPRLQRELRRANQLINKGEHFNAANIFLSLAERARDRGILQPASMLFLQAAYAYVLGNKVDAALERAYQGLEMLAADMRWQTLSREGERIGLALEEEGHQKQAEELRSWLGEKLKGQSRAMSPVPSKKSSFQLPEKCPYCGASMSMEQLNAGGARAAECHYCGSVVLPSQID